MVNVHVPKSVYRKYFQNTLSLYRKYFQNEKYKQNIYNDKYTIYVFYFIVLLQYVVNQNNYIYIYIFVERAMKTTCVFYFVVML